MFEQLKSIASSIFSKQTLIPLTIGGAIPVILSNAINFTNAISPGNELATKIGTVCDTLCTPLVDEVLNSQIVGGRDNTIEEAFDTVCYYLCNKKDDIFKP
jgi:hypothetical protein